ncbi:Peptidylprolyl isomerase domain and WD repeat containing protein 1 [Saguinus oedipus]|uniref:peptidylprolyl isomerase n=1 Tax=Saguinus oedipus TaxID=9490 RepID=A0ABQ9VTK5_SAGOE|nr:Peptidylprolyl isomerase domain and WD repeat containing protein 1 [Saguinus oedipus]
MSTKGEPEDRKSADSDGDVFNEKRSKEVMAATQAEGPKRVSDSAIIHTGMGGIHIKLFPAKTVENFCVHSRNGYYNGHAFHHIIKGFMIHTGDPTVVPMPGPKVAPARCHGACEGEAKSSRPTNLSNLTSSH